MTELYRLYHIAKNVLHRWLKQTDIAKMLHISPLGVSRMLRRAEDEGLVSISVRAPAKYHIWTRAGRCGHDTRCSRKRSSSTTTKRRPGADPSASPRRSM